MNLFERFWKTVDEKREAAKSEGVEFDLALTTVHPPDGVQNEAARDLTSIVKRCPRRYPPVVVSQPNLLCRPFCLIYTVAGDELPEFHELFESYVDKNAFIAETFLRLRPHIELPYLLFIGQKHFYLYDAKVEELLRWGSDFAVLDELLIQPIIAGKNVLESWDKFPRKDFAQRSEELARWLDLWKARIGARTNATPAFVQHLLQKVLLFFLFDQYFGFEEPELRLRPTYLEQRAALRRRKNASSPPPMPFDGVAWMNQASDEVCRRYHIDLLVWTQAEANFFALINLDSRLQFAAFIFEIFQLSHTKLDVKLQVDVFSDPDARLKLWKYAVTESVSIKRRLQVDDINVYEPVVIDLEESGVGWALHVVEQTLTFWKDRCEHFARELSERKSLQLQYDMFQTSDPEHAEVPLPEKVFDTAFGTSLRVYYDFPIARATLEYLVLLRTFEFCRDWRLPLQPLDCIAEMFVRKTPMSSVQEI